MTSCVPLIPDGLEDTLDILSPIGRYQLLATSDSKATRGHENMVHP